MFAAAVGMSKRSMGSAATTWAFTDVNLLGISGASGPINFGAEEP
jgi:hypothetical protein